MGNTKKAKGHCNLVRREMKKGPKFTVAAAVFSGEQDNPYQGNL